jgi:hypothetical protein
VVEAHKQQPLQNEATLARAEATLAKLKTLQSKPSTSISVAKKKSRLKRTDSTKESAVKLVIRDSATQQAIKEAITDIGQAEGSRAAGAAAVQALVNTKGLKWEDRHARGPKPMATRSPPPFARR